MFKALYIVFKSKQSVLIYSPWFEKMSSMSSFDKIIIYHVVDESKSTASNLVGDF